jgi:hypothetical protein
MSDNIRPALYDADYSCTLASRVREGAAPVLARVVGKHCESGDIVVKDEFLPADVAPGDLLAVPAPVPTAGRWPPTTTTCRARRWSLCGTGRARRRTARDRGRPAWLDLG